MPKGRTAARSVGASRLGWHLEPCRLADGTVRALAATTPLTTRFTLGRSECITADHNTLAAFAFAQPVGVAGSGSIGRTLEHG